MKLKRIRNVLKETYQQFGEIYYANYWNQGYTSALLDEKKITSIEHAGLAGYNDRLYFIEDMKIANRKIEIKKEESERMYLERIKKRIEKDLQKDATIILPSNAILTEEVRGRLRELNNALKVYKELIQKIVCMDESRYQYCWKDELIKHIKELEEKYYPEPKTTKEKINDIINDVWRYEREKGISSSDAEDIIDSLVRLRDE